MSKTEFTASANVRVTVEVMNLGPYGADWTAEKIHAQVEREAVAELSRLVQAGQQAAPRAKAPAEPRDVCWSRAACTARDTGRSGTSAALSAIRLLVNVRFAAALVVRSANIRAPVLSARLATVPEPFPKSLRSIWPNRRSDGNLWS